VKAKPAMFMTLAGLAVASSPAKRWRSSRTYQPNGERECARRRRQNARLNQATSHLLGIWPAHLGPRPTILYSQVGP
jgi:hypothetical protein